MPTHPWGAPPEANSTVLETGTTGATWVAGSAAWLGLASATLQTLGITGSQMFATLASTAGARQAIHSAATPPFLAWLGSLAGIAFKQAAVNAVIAESYTMARTTMVPTVQSVNNRVREAAAEASNIFGQNTPLIAALNAEYATYTTNNTTVGTTYGEVISAATMPVPIPPPPPLANAGATAGQAAQATGQAAATAAQAGSSKALTAAQATTQAGSQTGTGGAGQLGGAASMFQAPLQALQGLSSSFTSPISSLSSLMTAPLQAFGSASGLGGLLNGGSTGSSFVPTLGGGGLPLGSSGLGAGGSGLGGGGGGGGLGLGGGGVGPAGLSKQLTSSSGGGKTSVLSGVGPAGPAQERISATGTPMGGVPPMAGGLGGSGSRGRGAGETGVVAANEGVEYEPITRPATEEEQEYFR